MFGLGIGELLLIFVIFLIFFGPDKLPELAKNLGRAMAELRRTVDELKFDMNSTDYRPAPTPNKGPEATPRPSVTANLAAPAAPTTTAAPLDTNAISIEPAKTEATVTTAETETKHQA